LQREEVRFEHGLEKAKGISGNEGTSKTKKNGDVILEWIIDRRSRKLVRRKVSIWNWN
jgi:hypothetical protein